MKEKSALFPYAAYMLCMLLLNALIFVTPILAMQQSDVADAIYVSFSPFCHQLASRSLCLTSTYSMADCTVQDGSFSYSRANALLLEGGQIGYKFPVCSRDVAIYLAMLAGGIAYPFAGKIGRTQIPNKWLLALALVPIALDGGLQLLGFYESTNAMRMLTGAIAGFALPFYIIPMLNMAADNVFSHFPRLHKILFK